ncbi:MAG TPA: hypothetical protein VMC10_14110 [Stellaceae bacterium]|nr:hypothetical protein [Stellaceae bacterium]HUN45000.1 hypothetical protein [Stellaceae bacterium]
MKMKAPAGCRQVSHDGRAYEVNADGIVEVPEAARVELEAHGFVRVAEPKTRPQPRPRKARE